VSMSPCPAQVGCSLVCVPCPCVYLSSLMSQHAAVTVRAQTELRGALGPVAVPCVSLSAMRRRTSASTQELRTEVVSAEHAVALERVTPCRTHGGAPACLLLHVATWSRCLWSALTTCKRSLAVRTLLPVQSFFDIFEAEPKECKRRERRTRLPWQPFHVADSSRHQSSRQRD